MEQAPETSWDSFPLYAPPITISEYDNLELLIVTTDLTPPTGEDYKDNKNRDVLSHLNSLECGKDERAKSLERADIFPFTINSQSLERGSLLTW